MRIEAKDERKINRLIKLGIAKNPTDLVHEAIQYYYRAIITEEIGKAAKAQAEYYKEHPEEAETVMRIQGLQP